MNKRLLLATVLLLGACGGKGPALPTVDARVADSAVKDALATSDSTIGGKVEVGTLPDAPVVIDTDAAVADAGAPDAAVGDAAPLPADAPVVLPPSDAPVVLPPPDAPVVPPLPVDAAEPPPALDAPAATPDALEIPDAFELPDGLQIPDGLPPFCLTTCLGIERLYQTAFATAATCDADMLNQCSHPTTRTLTCPYPAYVNDTLGLDLVRAQWDAAGCGACMITCPPTTPPAAPACVRSALHPTGACTNSFFP